VAINVIGDQRYWRSTTGTNRERELTMPELKTDSLEKLVRSATQARDQAYAPHSHFYVGAALLMDDGHIVSGCNVENASYSLSICAERVAAAAAVARGHRSWRAIAIASVGGVMPCGACRQFLAEFGTDITVILVDVIDGSRRTRKLADLLPEAFDLSSLPSHD
jgi:cytidine deaminase